MTRGLPHLSALNRWFSLFALLALGLLIRVWHLSGQSLSHDEVTELLIARRGISDIIHTTDGLPPLYNLLLHASLSLFADDVAGRSLSVLFGMLSIYVVWLLAREIGGDRIGLWTALLIAVSPLHIWYSQEGRAYALYLLLATISTL